MVPQSDFPTSVGFRIERTEISGARIERMVRDWGIDVAIDVIQPIESLAELAHMIGCGCGQG